MLRILISTTLAAALAAPLAAPSFADTHTTAAWEMIDSANLIRTRDITGGPVYSIANRYDETAWMNRDDREFYGYNNYAYGSDYEQIGEIEDVVLDQGGQMIGIVAEVGGFLDIGDKHVLVPVEDLRLVPVDDTSYSYITRLSEEQLEEMPGVDEAGWD